MVERTWDTIRLCKCCAGLGLGSHRNHCKPSSPAQPATRNIVTLQRCMVGSWTHKPPPLVCVFLSTENCSVSLSLPPIAVTQVAGLKNRIRKQSVWTENWHYNCTVWFPTSLLPLSMFSTVVVQPCECWVCEGSIHWSLCCTSLCSWCQLSGWARCSGGSHLPLCTLDTACDPLKRNINCGTTRFSFAMMVHIYMARCTVLFLGDC